MNVRADIDAMTGAHAVPRDNGEIVFDEPWHARTFGMAVALVEHLDLDWSAFQQRLITAIAEDPDRPYYESWTVALEDLVNSLDLA